MKAIRPLLSMLAVLATGVGLASRASAQFMDRQITVFTLADQFEYRPSGSGRPLQWDLAAWVGDSYSRLWIKSEGDWNTARGGTELDLRAEYGRLVLPFWELQGGVRIEGRRRGNLTDMRAHLELGLLGLAPYWFQLEPEFFIAQDGQVSARLTAEQDLLLTQRLIVQPRLEVYGAFSENRTFGVGSGFNYVEPGVRIRYELRRELAPYVGVEWLRELGNTARLARSDGEATSKVALVAGVRVWR